MSWSMSQSPAPLWTALPVLPLPLSLTTPSLLLILLTLTLLLIIFQNATRYSRSGLPGPPTLPIIGSLPWLPRNQPPKVSLGHLATKYGPIFEMNFGMRRMVIISSPSLANRILIEQSSKVGGERSWMSFTRDMDLDRIFPSACANSNPIIEPCRRLNMKVLRIVGNAATARACQQTLRSFPAPAAAAAPGGGPSRTQQGSTLDPMEIGMAYGLTLLTDAAFGLDLTYEEINAIPEIKQIFNVSREVLATVTLTSEFFLTFPALCILKPWEALRSKSKARDIRKRFLEACEALEKCMLANVEANPGRWETWKECTFKQTYGQNSQDGKKISLQQQGEESDAEGFLHPLLQSVITLVAGAHSISAVTAAVLACLAYETSGQSQQEKLHVDVKQFEQTHSHSDMQDRKLEAYPPRALAIVRETLRRFSPSPVALPLQTSSDIHVSPNVTLHKGTMILALSEHLNAAHTRTQWDPDTLLALNESQKIISAAAASERGHFSFGFGRRRCPAADFSERAIAAFVSDVVRDFRVEFDVEQRHKSMEDMMHFEYTGFNQAPRPPRIVLTRRT